MRYLILVLAMVLGCAAEGVEPTVQIGGYGSDIVTPDIQGTDAVQGTDVEGSDVEGTDVAQPDVQGVDVEGTDVQGVDIQVDTQPDVQADTQDAQVEVQEDVQVDVQPDTQQPDVQVDKEVQADVQVDVQPDVQDVQDAQPDIQPDTQQPDIQPDTQQPDVQDVQGPDVQVDAGKDTQDTKPQYECKTNADCADKFSCTVDSCVWGYCEHEGPKVSCDDGNACTQDICTAKGTCLNPVAPLIECDDGNPCTKFDQCDKAGTCWAGHTPKCEDYNECTENVCNTSTGDCTFKALPVKTPCKGTGCSPGKCTSNGVCDNPYPVTYNPGPGSLFCDDGNPCTNDSCNWTNKEGCVHEWIPFCKP